MAIFMGYLGMLYCPSDDYFRYVEEYNLIASFSFDEVLDYLALKFDYIKTIIYWILSNLGFESTATRFVFNYIGYLLLFSIFMTLSSQATKPNRIRLFCILLFFVSFKASLPRFGLASILFVYGVIEIIFNKRKGWVFCVLACLTHFSIIVAFIVFLVSHFSGISINRRYIPVIILCSVFFNTNLLSPILYAIGDSVPMVAHILEYTDGFWANDYYNETSFFYKIYAFLGSISYYFLIYYFYKTYKNNELSSVIVAFLLFIIIVSPFRGICVRYQYITFIFMMFYAIHDISKHGFLTKNIRKYFFWIGSLSILVSIWTCRLELSISNEKYILTPSIAIWSAEYSSSWYKTHIDSEGHPI